MKSIFAEKIRNCRMKKGLSQEQLAQQLDVSNQAVSKWECAISYPDIELLIKIADFFEITMDELLREDAGQTVQLKGLPDDDVIRIVQCRGRQVVSFENIEKPLLLKLDDAAMKGLSDTKEIDIIIKGKARIEGNLYGNVTAENGLNCGNVHSGQSIYVNGGLNCGNVSSGQEIHVNGAVNSGNLNSGQEIQIAGKTNCGNIEAREAITVGGDLRCDRVQANTVSCKKLDCKRKG